MAIWDGSTYNTDKLASAINKWESKNFVPMVVKRNCLFYAMMGFKGDGNVNVPDWTSVISKDYDVSGIGLVVRLLGELETFSTVADANQFDAVVWDNNPNSMGLAEFPWTHYSKNFAVQDSDFDLIRGNEAKTASFLQDKLFALTRGWYNELGNQINSNNAPSRTQLGGWPYAVSATGTYGTLTRTGDNPDWSGNEADVGGDGSFEDLDNMKRDIEHDGGNATFGVMPKVPFNKILAENRTLAAAVPTNWSLYEGGGLIHYNGTTFAFEDRMAPDIVGMFDPRALRYYQKSDEPLFTVINQETMKALLKGAKLGFALRVWNAFIVKAPGWCGKLKNWTS